LVEPSKSSPIAVPVQAFLVFAIPRSKSGKLLTPVGDGDNYEKAIYDLIQAKGYLEDDRLITTGTWAKRFLPYKSQGYTSLRLYAEHEEIEL
jgi:Holliday junction resolvase RusA-like endonuclease